MNDKDNDKPRPIRRGNSGDGLGIRAVNKEPPDVPRLARAYIGVILARRYENRDAANTAMASYPIRHTPSPRRPRAGRKPGPAEDTPQQEE